MFCEICLNEIRPLENTKNFEKQEDNCQHEGVTASKLAFAGLKLQYPNTPAFILGRDVNSLIVV